MTTQNTNLHPASKGLLMFLLWIAIFCCGFAYFYDVKPGTFLPSKEIGLRDTVNTWYQERLADNSSDPLSRTAHWFSEVASKTAPVDNPVVPVDETEDLRAALARAEQQIEELQEKFQATSLSEQSLRKKLAAAEANGRKLTSDLTAEKARAKELQAELSVAREQNSELTLDLQAANREKAGLLQQAKELEQSLTAERRQHALKQEQLEAALTGKETENSALKAQIAELEKKLKEAGDNPTPPANSDLDERVTTLEKARETLELKLKGQDAQIETLLAAVKELQKARQEDNSSEKLTALEKKLAALETAVSELKASQAEGSVQPSEGFKKLSEQVETISDELKTLKEKVSDNSGAEELKKLQERMAAVEAALKERVEAADNEKLQKLEQAVRALQEKVASLPSLEEKDLEKALTPLKEKITALTAELAALKTTVAGNDQATNVKKLEDEVQLLTKTLQKVQEESATAAELTELQKSLKKLSADVENLKQLDHQKLLDEALKPLQQQLQNLEKSLGELKGTLKEEFSETVNGLTEKIQSLQQKLDELEKTAVSQAAHEELKQSLTKAEARIKELEDVDHQKALEKLLKPLLSRMVAAEEALERLEQTEQENTESSTATLQDLKKRLRKLEEKAAKEARGPESWYFRTIPGGVVLSHPYRNDVVSPELNRLSRRFNLPLSSWQATERDGCLVLYNTHLRYWMTPIQIEAVKSSRSVMVQLRFSGSGWYSGDGYQKNVPAATALPGAAHVLQPVTSSAPSASPAIEVYPVFPAAPCNGFCPLR